VWSTPHGWITLATQRDSPCHAMHRVACNDRSESLAPDHASGKPLSALSASASARGMPPVRPATQNPVPPSSPRGTEV
jgi:hypothetical protein